MTQRWLFAALAWASMFTAATGHADVQGPGWKQVQRVAPPRMYSPSVERYRYGHTNVNNPDFYPIPQEPVTRATYMRWLETSGVLAYADKPERGQAGLAELLGALAKYVQTGDDRWGQACIAMLKEFHRATVEEVGQKGWSEQFAVPPALIPVYRRFLIDGGAMAPDEPWFKELWLYYCRNLHVWNSEPIEWRGACHRSMPEALAAKWYPDIPEASHWSCYAQQVWGDFWSVKDLQQNDTGYMQDSVRAYAFSGDQLLGDNRYLSDSGMRPLWERLAAEITPDGAINPYGPNGGWNSTAALRVAVLERVAAATRDGRFRFVAHKAMQYLQYQTEPTLKDHYLAVTETAPYMALAYLFADDVLKPVRPDSGSCVNYRRETVRIPHTDKEIVGKYLKDIDPTANRGHLCCNTAFTNRSFPNKLVLRSGWKPGDFFALVELMPTSFPCNAGGIMGMNRWGAPFAQVVTSRGGTPENRMHIVDLSGTAPRRYVDNPDLINEAWKRGKMEDMTSEVQLFHDANCATVARIAVQNPEGLPVRYIREFIFAKNRFLASRGTVVFEEGFDAQVAALWNTQNVGPQIGAHWANTFIGAPVASNGQIEMKTPPADLLVYFVPQAGWRMQVVDRTADDPRTEVTPAQVRYVWEGTTTPGQRLHSTQLYYPHTPSRTRASTVDLGAQAVYREGEIAATAGASGIAVVRDTAETTLLLTAFDARLREWTLFNPRGEVIRYEGFQTDARYGYIRSANRAMVACVMVEATFLEWNGKEVFGSKERQTVER